MGGISGGSGGGGAPTTAGYIVTSADAGLTAERVLTAGANITLTDAGPGGTLTVAAAGGGGAFKGALALVTVNKSIPNDVLTILDFDSTVYDTNAFWSGANPSRFTIPAGISKVVITLGVVFALNGTGYRLAALFKNNSSFSGGFRESQNAIGTTADSFSTVSPVLDVVQGDFFDIRIRQNSGANLDVSSGGQTYFGIHVIA